MSVVWIDPPKTKQTRTCRPTAFVILEEIIVSETSGAPSVDDRFDSAAFALRLVTVLNTC